MKKKVNFDMYCVDSSKRRNYAENLTLLSKVNVRFSALFRRLEESAQFLISFKNIGLEVVASNLKYN